MALSLQSIVPSEDPENNALSESAKLLQEAEIEELVALYISNITNVDDMKEILSFIRKKNTNDFSIEIPWPYDEDTDKLIHSLSFIKKGKDNENMMKDLLDIREHYRIIKTLPPSKQIEIYIQAEVCTALWARAYPSNIIEILKKCIIANHLDLVK